MTITPQTEVRYRTRAAQITHRVQAARGQQAVTVSEIAEWLLAQRPHYSKATWRQYRAALIYVWRQRDAKDAVDIAEAITRLQQTAPPPGRPSWRNTSAQKLKKIPEADLVRLLDYINCYPTRHGYATLCWLLAGLWTGLRPSEWAHAQLITPTQLQVINAKATHGRSHGVHRNLDLAPLTAQEREIIQIHLNHVQDAKRNPANPQTSGFEGFYNQCRSCLYERTRKLWPKRQKHITLYSARHQFAANAKFKGLPLDHIAALMGHASTDTATSHYGRRSAGRGGRLIEADQDDIARVQSLNQWRMENKQDKGMKM
jgi:hypothetical protein